MTTNKFLYDTYTFNGELNFYFGRNKDIKTKFTDLMRRYVEHAGLTKADIDEYDEYDIDEEWGYNLVDFAERTDNDKQVLDVWCSFAQLGDAIYRYRLAELVYKYIRDCE